MGDTEEHVCRLWEKCRSAGGGSARWQRTELTESDAAGPCPEVWSLLKCFRELGHCLSSLWIFKYTIRGPTLPIANSFSALWWNWLESSTQTSPRVSGDALFISNYFCWPCLLTEGCSTFLMKTGAQQWLRGSACPVSLPDTALLALADCFRVLLIQKYLGEHLCCPFQCHPAHY